MKLTQRFPAVVAPLWALLLAVPALADALRAGLYVGNGTDLYSYQYPMRATVAALWHQGQAPWWNPYLLGGVPALAGWQLGLLYPPHCLHLLWPLGATEAMLWLHLAWLAAGGAWLAQRWHAELPAWGAVAAAGAVALAGQTWGHIFAGHVSWVEALAWTPWLWGALLGWLKHRRLQQLAWAAVVLAMQLLVGHPQLVYLSLVGAGILLAARSADPAPSPALGKPAVAAAPTNADAIAARWPTWVAAAVGLGTAGIWAGALAAGQLGPTIGLAPALNRVLSTPLEIATSYSAPAVTLWTAWAPAALGGAAAKLSPHAYHETLAFVGPAYLALALTGAALAGRRGAILLTGSLIAVLLSVGEHGPLLPALVDWLPGAGAFRVPGRWLVIAALLQVPLVAEALAGAQSPLRHRWPWWGAALLGAASVYGLATLGGDGGWLAKATPTAAPVARQVAVSAAETGLLLGVAASAAALAMALQPNWRRGLAGILTAGALLHGLWFAAQHLGPERRLTPQRLQWSSADAAALREELGRGHRLATAPSLRQANWPGTIGVAGAGGYEPAITLETNRVANVLAGRKPEGYAVLFQVRGPSATADRLAVSHALVAAEDAQAARAFAAWPISRTLPSGLQLRRNPALRPRVEWTAQPQPVESSSQAAQLLAASLGPGPVLVQGAAQGRAAAGEVALQAETATEVVLTSRSDGPGWVVLRDAWAPGWEVRVDDSPATMHLADGMLRAVAVTAGPHQIAWRYTPQTWPWSPLVSAAAWLATAALLWRSRKRGRLTEAVDKRIPPA